MSMKDKARQKQSAYGAMDCDSTICVCDRDGWQEMETTEAVQGQVLHPPLLSLSIWHIQHYCRAVCGDKQRNKLQDETCRAAQAPQHTDSLYQTGLG